MKHQPLLSNSFKEVTSNNLSKLDYKTSNYIPVYSIGFPQFFSSLDYYLRNLPNNYKNFNYLNNRLLNFYYNKKGRRNIDFNEQEFKNIIRVNI